MFTISFVDRVRLNYSSCTIASIVLYTFFVSILTEYCRKLWPHVIYFVVAEVFKLFIIQKFYSLDVTNNYEGIRRKQKMNKVGDSLKFAALMLLTVCIFAFVCIVLGAPVFDHYEETFTLSALLTSLTLFPVSIFVGVSGTISLLATESYELTNIVSQSYLKLLKRNAILVTCGAYIASIVFPLDWDRPWQIYPIPNIVGAITGHMMGSFYCYIETMIKYKLGKKKH